VGSLGGAAGGQTRTVGVGRQGMASWVVEVAWVLALRSVPVSYVLICTVICIRYEHLHQELYITLSIASVAQTFHLSTADASATDPRPRCDSSAIIDGWMR
jgi:hypothetical protein